MEWGQGAEVVILTLFIFIYRFIQFAHEARLDPIYKKSKMN